MVNYIKHLTKKKNLLILLAILLLILVLLYLSKKLMYLKEGISEDKNCISLSGSIPDWMNCPELRPALPANLDDLPSVPKKLTTGEWSNNKDSNNMVVEPPPLAQRTQLRTQNSMLEGNVYDFNKGCWIYMPKPCWRKNTKDPSSKVKWSGAWAPNGVNVGKPTDSSNPNQGVWLHDTWNTRGTKAYTESTCKARSLAFNPDSTWCTGSTREGHDQVSYHFAEPEACAPGQKCATTASSTQWRPPDPSPPSCDTTWAKCASEGGNCVFDGTKDILYKRSDDKEPNNYKLFKNKTSSVACNNSIDGDPAYGHGKSCYYCPPPPPPAPPAPPAPPPPKLVNNSTKCYLWTAGFNGACQKDYGKDWILDTRTVPGPPDPHADYGKYKGGCITGQGRGVCVKKSDIKVGDKLVGTKCGAWNYIADKWCKEDFGSDMYMSGKKQYGCAGGFGRATCVKTKERGTGCSKDYWGKSAQPICEQKFGKNSIYIPMNSQYQDCGKTGKGAWWTAEYKCATW